MPGIFGRQYHIHLPRSIAEGELPSVQEKVARALGVEPTMVICQRHDPCFMDPEDRQAEWILATVLEHVGPKEVQPLHGRETVCRTLYTYFGRTRTVSATDATGGNAFVQYAQ